MRALVVFHDGGAVRHPLGFLLRKGFRHCFVCLLSGEYWMRVDGEAGVPVLEFLTAADFDLAGFYRRQGYTVVATEQRARPIRAPVVAANCVGLVKAVLCVRSLALTPYRLYRHLLRMTPCN